MASTLHWKAVATQAIYRAYPDSDLPPIEIPAAGETIDDFALRAEAAADTLFLFLYREANDDVGIEKCRNRLDRAAR